MYCGIKGNSLKTVELVESVLAYSDWKEKKNNKEKKTTKKEPVFFFKID